MGNTLGTVARDDAPLDAREAPELDEEAGLRRRQDDLVAPFVEGSWRHRAGERIGTVNDEPSPPSRRDALEAERAIRRGRS